MRYKNIAGRFFGLVTKHACDRRIELGLPRPRWHSCVVRQKPFLLLGQVLNTDVDGGCDQHCCRPSEVSDIHRRTKLTAPETISRSRDMVVPARIKMVHVMT